VTVDSTSDLSNGDTSSITALIASPGVDDVISLREAIAAANNTPGSDTIEFKIPLADPNHSGGVWLINLTASLPTLSDGGTVIRGDTQAAFIGGDPNPNGPEIEINGLGIFSGSCFIISSPNNVIHGLVINRCSVNGISISGSSATTNTISGNYIGTDALGSSDLGNTYIGVYILSGAQNNTIGGDTPVQRNIISGNGWHGVLIDDSGTDGNTVSGNYIGTDAQGSSDLGNSKDGVRIEDGAQNNVIGGDTPGERNIISGNSYSGVKILGSGTDGNTVSGNYIGTDVTGLSGLGNDTLGVAITGGAQLNVVGGDTEGERNIISGNGYYLTGYSGVRIADTGTDGNTVSGNYIGTDATGSSDLANALHGVYIYGGAQNNLIGGDIPGERNIISGNSSVGVGISGSETDGNTVSGNYIGTDALGSSDLGNSNHGVLIEHGAQNNTVGGQTAGERNIISRNGGSGVRIAASGSMSNTISGNYIGTDALGSSDLGNSYHGVYIDDGAHNNTIGGDTPGERNIISGNDWNGVRIADSGTDGNTISGNYIGTDAAGSSDLGNTSHGVAILTGAQNNVVGPDNLIASNDSTGVYVSGATTTGNTITQNSIHSNVGLGIYLASGGNANLPAPNISAANACFAAGTAGAGDTVEVFTGPDEEGKTYLATALADGAGAWWVVGPFTLDTYVTATATDASGNTSRFSTEATPGTCYPGFLPLAVKRY
jgi:titin